MKNIFAGYYFMSLISGGLMLSSCNNNSRSYANLPYEASDTVVKEIPEDKNGIQVPYYRITKEREKILGLNALEDGYDSLQIRIWGEHAGMSESHVLIISYNREWQAKLVTLVYSIDDRTRSYVFRNKRSRIVNPRSGWKSLTAKLFDLQLLALPDMSILGWENGEDGSCFSVEAGTKKSYRFYSYWSPEEYQDQHWQAKSMSAIIQLAETEFGFRFKSGTL